ncbi:hypothetical protein FJ656_37055 [Schumannella luteola]|uniref:Flagellar biosynthesis/type III secretory pathway M-ring protein FliF/YscJ n=1 Tax=Schumannella luteola TaxID=472059 RepID=A0A852YRN9_9MICO|nr:hypothetical protein [Schumannella luteola]NYG99915.1 flagellar biosynthesis/type III secretory pathway M-ring protein FliF/YscJ [Schumannella luteola]TPW90511.1 hypothetical protein FJ656_37055 [Schumannella luteola]
MPDDSTPLLTALAGGGILAILLSIVLSVGGAALGLWLVYTVIWRAVRRGLRERAIEQHRAEYGAAAARYAHDEQADRERRAHDDRRRADGLRDQPQLERSHQVLREQSYGSIAGG